MQKVSLRCALGMMIGLGIAAMSTAPAAGQVPAAGRRNAAMLAEANSPATPSKVRTGKERLGAKWMDEQRIDNCKVPIDKRGTTPRPDTCSNVPIE